MWGASTQKVVRRLANDEAVPNEEVQKAHRTLEGIEAREAFEEARTLSMPRKVRRASRA
jgi:ribosome-binding protein aMBF1 (putative translation factor)